jgi:hypothetical protein
MYLAVNEFDLAINMCAMDLCHLGFEDGLEVGVWTVLWGAVVGPNGNWSILW